MVHVLLKQSDASGEAFLNPAALYTHQERNQLNIGQTSNVCHIQSRRFVVFTYMAQKGVWSLINVPTSSHLPTTAALVLLVWYFTSDLVLPNRVFV